MITKVCFVKYFIIPTYISFMVIRQSNGSQPAQHGCQLSGGWAWYLLITVQWLSLLTKTFRWDISAVSSCSSEKRFVNCHFELNIQSDWQQPGISGRPITSPVFTHPVVSEPCPLCSEAIHSSYTKWKPTCVESMTCWPFSTSLDIVKTCNFNISCCEKNDRQPGYGIWDQL